MRGHEDAVALGQHLRFVLVHLRDFLFQLADAHAQHFRIPIIVEFLFTLLIALLNGPGDPERNQQHNRGGHGAEEHNGVALNKIKHA